MSRICSRPRTGSCWTPVRSRTRRSLVSGRTWRELMKIPRRTHHKGDEGRPRHTVEKAAKRHFEVMCLHLKHDRWGVFDRRGRPVNLDISLMKLRLNMSSRPSPRPRKWCIETRWGKWPGARFLNQMLSLSSWKWSPVNQFIFRSVHCDVSIDMTSRGGAHGMRIHRKQRNQLSKIIKYIKSQTTRASPRNKSQQNEVLFPITIFNVWLQRTRWSLFRILSLSSLRIDSVSPDSAHLRNLDHLGFNNYPWSTIHEIQVTQVIRVIQVISNDIHTQRIMFCEESDPVIDDWPNMLAKFENLPKISQHWAPSAKQIKTNGAVSSHRARTQQYEREYQWELDVEGQSECTRQQVLSEAERQTWRSVLIYGVSIDALS
jgi:hypothetical protein